MNKYFLPLAVVSVVFATSSINAASSVHNDFSDGTSQGWNKGGGKTIQPTIETEASGNKYLKIKTATEESAPDKKVTFQNSGSWKGNYNTKGIKAIFARFNNRSSVPLEMHIAFRTELADLNVRYVVKKGAVIPPDGEWHDAIFSIADDDLQLVDKKGHGGSDLKMTAKQVKNRVVQVRFTNGTLGEETGTGHGDGIYTGWNDGAEVDAELWIDDIILSTEQCPEGQHFMTSMGHCMNNTSM